MVGIGIIHCVVGDAGHVYACTEELGLIGHGDEREEAAVAEAPNANAVAIYVGKSS